MTFSNIIILAFPVCARALSLISRAKSAPHPSITEIGEPGWPFSTDNEEPGWVGSEFLGTPSNIPKNQRIALVVRGNAFRCMDQTCCGDAWSNQMLATRSQVTHVIQPLEQYGNTVDIYMTDSPCAMTKDEIDMYNMNGSQRVKEAATGEADMQATGVRMALENFKKACHPEDYSHVFFVRHDLSFPTHMDKWPTDFSKLNVASRCEEGNQYGPDNACINDVFFIIPSASFQAFDEAVGTGNCFNAEDGGFFGNGHRCWDTLEAAMSAINHPIGFAFSYTPYHYNREANGWTYLYHA